jgi:outer membrane biogenesis lipoprotein LolB
MRVSRYLAALALAFLVACSTTPASSDPRQQAVDATYKTGLSLDASVNATRAAIQAGVLKGADAANALKAFEVTQASLKAAQAALKAEPAASGVAK